MRRKMGLIAIQGTFLACLLVPGFAFAVGTPAPAPSTNPPVATPTPDPTNGVGEFVPLTHLPQIQSLSQAQGFATFVNTFYKILIGVGAVLAVLMIMYAGFEFMKSSGSVTGNEKAKGRIQNAIFGLILVLAPTIVFGIINPDILNLNLGTEFVKLQQKSGVDQSAFQTNVASSTNSTGSYLLAAYVIFTNSSTNASCYVRLVQTYTTQNACNTSKSAAPASFGTKDGWTRSGVTFVRSCELSDSGYTLTVPGNVPLCTN